jgi:hypothetical protein
LAPRRDLPWALAASLALITQFELLVYAIALGVVGVGALVYYRAR